MTEKIILVDEKKNTIILAIIDGHIMMKKSSLQVNRGDSERGD